MEHFDVIIVGAGAAGLMCAIQAGQRGRSVLLLDKANKVGKKILMSGGGRCNFTNYNVCPEKYLSHNPRFCISALSRYTQWDFIALVEKHGIAYHEKTLGQLFCDNKSSDIVTLLLNECADANVTIKLNQTIQSIATSGNGFMLKLSTAQYQCDSLVIASGGLSIPTMGASPFGYHVAEQFGLPLYPTRAGLVPFTLQPKQKERLSILSGVSVDCEVRCNGRVFREAMLFTHRGLSGPAMLQISSYWMPGETIVINLLPDLDLRHVIEQGVQQSPEMQLLTLLTRFIPKRLLHVQLQDTLAKKSLKHLNDACIKTIEQALQHWAIVPNNTEGYRTAEVTLGGVDTRSISSKTFATVQNPNLYFIGEVLDVSGWLGGYNFQWAWSSGWAAGQVV